MRYGAIAGVALLREPDLVPAEPILLPRAAFTA
jgi:hypothetical protein